jgi:hypothetical protein
MSLTDDELRAIEYNRRYLRRAEFERFLNLKLQGNSSLAQTLIEKTQAITNEEILYVKGNKIGIHNDNENRIERGFESEGNASNR